MTGNVARKIQCLLLLLRCCIHCRAQDVRDAATTVTAVIGVETIDEAAASSSRLPHDGVPDDCTLVMAESSIPDAGWGVYTLTGRRAEEPLLQRRRQDGAAGYGDVVIQIPDLRHPLGAKKLLWEYLWDGQETGGQYEGYRVVSFAPGVAMLANGHGTSYNVLPSLRPAVDDAGVTRSSSPNAGAVTRYHNFTWFVSRDMAPGDEVLVNYGVGWFRERGLERSLSSSSPRSRPSLGQLRRHGYCLDNLRPGPSNVPHAGRGAFATRPLPKGAVVAPVPVLPVSASSLTMVKQHESGRSVETQQLLRNYCFGHSRSSLLLCPYSDMVHLVNHGAAAGPSSNATTNAAAANVRLRWSTAHGPQSFPRPVDALQETSTRMLLELVASRDIEEGEEVLLDYGSDWVDGWNRHVDQWQERPDDAAYVPSFALNQERPQKAVRTVAEQKRDPYPDNVFTSCYHKLEKQDLQSYQPDRNGKVKPVLEEWKPSKGIYETRHLRPCLVLERRVEGETNNYGFYTVRLLNRPGTPEVDRIPKNVQILVRSVPRKAIQFSDKLYTTDQHLETAFRHSIGLEDGVFPTQWMDLVPYRIEAHPA